MVYAGAVGRHFESLRRARTRYLARPGSISAVPIGDVSQDGPLATPGAGPTRARLSAGPPWATHSGGLATGSRARLAGPRGGGRLVEDADGAGRVRAEVHRGGAGQLGR
jgi:hypothetical protein